MLLLEFSLHGSRDSQRWSRFINRIFGVPFWLNPVPYLSVPALSECLCSRSSQQQLWTVIRIYCYMKHTAVSSSPLSACICLLPSASGLFLFHIFVLCRNIGLALAYFARQETRVWFHCFSRRPWTHKSHGGGTFVLLGGLILWSTFWITLLLLCIYLFRPLTVWYDFSILHPDIQMYSCHF